MEEDGLRMEKRSRDKLKIELEKNFLFWRNLAKDKNVGQYALERGWEYKVLSQVGKFPWPFEHY